MCGLAGFFAARPVADPQPMLARMLSRLRHRGPDGAGCWLDPSGVAGFAHARLAIIDLTDAAGQPMTSSDGRYVLAFNGEIYNYIELRRQLIADGHQLRTHSDTEAVLALLATEGVSALRRLRGMFALAAWDVHAQRGWLARDGFGIKPLYYREDGQGVVFASELRALLASGACPFELDPIAMAGFFATGSVPEPRSLVANVGVIPAGHVLEWSPTGACLRRFWSIDFPEPRGMSAKEAVDATRAALEASVAAHFVSDVPVGLFLSGGIDSSALLALAHQGGYADGMDTFSIAVDDAMLDEGDVATATARHFGVRHHLLRLDGEGARNALDSHLDAMDVPSVDGFNTWMVSLFAREHGMKVVLSGLGGDELFGGYPSFTQVPRLHRWVRGLQRAGVAPFAAGLLARQPWSPRAQRVAGMLQSAGELGDIHAAYRGIFPSADVARLVTHFIAGPGGEPPRQPSDHPVLAPIVASGDERDRVSLLEMTRYMRHQLLRDSDVMSMAHGLELRLPMVDTFLFDALAGIPAHLRLQPGKRLLTSAVPEIPVMVRNAAKRGFRFPFGEWFGAVVDPYAQVVPVRASTWYQRWVLMVFILWVQARRRDAAS